MNLTEGKESESKALHWKINKRIIYVNTYTTVKGIPN